ncbi:histidine phosphatase family protein [Microlunatus elymi]|uniref:histidine phosphatase family protein n=1 Tax=Microlunatus elymi TaxID=2596828 RepID=UPI00143D4508|nr:histidine phosphatase family protein [Microlunatus elymi]
MPNRPGPPPITADAASATALLGFDPAELRNTYAVMRHGQSHPNVAGVIVCRPDAGIDPANGLTELGRQQARDAALLWTEDQDRPPVIISSDFTRALETAEELRTITGADPVIIDVRLRERDFGSYDGGPVSGYDEVWAADAAGTCIHGIESVADVLARTAELIKELDARYQDQQIVLVSHGDTAQITIAAFAGVRPDQHRSLPGLGNAEIRPLTGEH